MQTLINILAVSSFLMSAAVIGTGTYLYLNRNLIIEEVKGTVQEAVMEEVTDLIPALPVPSLPTDIDSSIPSSPISIPF